MKLFSQRHSKETLKHLSLPQPVRNKLFYVLSESSSFEYGDSTFNQADYQYRRSLGLDKITAFAQDGSKNRVSSNLDGVIKRGYPSEVLDMVEAFHSVLAPKERPVYEPKVNQVLQEAKQPWRLMDGKIVKLDSDYLAEEVLSKAYSLLDAPGFEGPLEEFQQAMNDYSSGDYRGAITNASNAFESTMKVILGVQTEAPGKLVRSIIDSGLLPSYYSGFLDSVKTILAAVIVERNQPGRAHGQGSTATPIDPSFAEVCLHLAGTAIVFLVRRHREKSALPDDLPF